MEGPLSRALPAAAVLDLVLLGPQIDGHARERPALAGVVHWHPVLRAVAVELLDELPALRHLALEDVPEVILVPDDVGGQEQEQVHLLLLGGVVAEEPADHRDVPEERGLVARLDDPVLHQPTDDHRFLVLGHDDGLGRPLGGRGAEDGIGAGDLLGRLIDRHADVVALVDLRLDLQFELDVLALDLADRQRTEPTDPAQRAARASQGRAGAAQKGPQPAEAEAGLERHVLADGDFGVLVVARQDVRRGKHVAVARGLQGLEQHREGGKEGDVQDLRQLGVVRSLQAGQEPTQTRETLHTTERVQPLANRERLGAEWNRDAADARNVGRDDPVRGAADVELVVEIDLHDDRLHEDLAARHVELLDDLDEIAVVAPGRDDHERVGGLVGADLDGRFEDRLIGRGIGVGISTRAGRLLGGGGTLDEGGQDRGHLVGDRVAQVVDVNLALPEHRDIELPEDGLDLVEGARAGDHDQLVGPLVGNRLGQVDAALVAALLGRAAFGGDHLTRTPTGPIDGNAETSRVAPRLLVLVGEDVGDLVDQLGGRRVVDLDDPHLIATVGHIDLIDDPLDAVHVHRLLADQDQIGLNGPSLSFIAEQVAEQPVDGVGIDVLQAEESRDVRLVVRVDLFLAQVGRDRPLRRRSRRSMIL